MNSTLIKAYISLARIDRPVGIYLVLWPALWSLWLANKGWPDFKLLTIFIIGTILMRSAGCVINDIADRKLDGEVARTCNRPLATGVLNTYQALYFFIALTLLSFILVLCLNSLTIYLSFGAIALACLYPFMKRYTYWPQAFLGAAFAWAIPMGFAATLDTVPQEAWLVFSITMLWALIYDTAYGLVDKQDDLKIGIKSTAILFGRNTNLVIGLFQLIMLCLLIWMGFLFNLNDFYYLALALVSSLFLYHQSLLQQNKTNLAFKMFLNNHWVGFIILIGIILGTIK